MEAIEKEGRAFLDMPKPATWTNTVTQHIQSNFDLFRP
jgi:hypothetical protein